MQTLFCLIGEYQVLYGLKVDYYFFKVRPGGIQNLCEDALVLLVQVQKTKFKRLDGQLPSGNRIEQPLAVPGRCLI